MVDKKLVNFEFFRSQLGQFLANPLLHNKFVVIQNSEVKNAFDTFDAALRFAVGNFPVDEFIVQQVVDEREVANFIHAPG